MDDSEKLKAYLEMFRIQVETTHKLRELAWKIIFGFWIVVYAMTIFLDNADICITGWRSWIYVIILSVYLGFYYTQYKQPMKKHDEWAHCSRMNVENLLGAQKESDEDARWLKNVCRIWKKYIGVDVVLHFLFSASLLSLSWFILSKG